MTNSIKFWRKLRALNQNDLAKKIGVEQPTISGFENGEREPTAECWELIASALDVTVDMLFARPPITLGGTKDFLVERTAGVPSIPGEETGKSKKARKPPQGFGSVNFLTPSQAKVGVQLQKTIKLNDEEWDGVRVWVELPCEDDAESIRETKIEAVRYCQNFVEEEIGRITQSYINQFNGALVGRVEDGDGGEVTGLLENP